MEPDQRPVVPLLMMDDPTWLKQVLTHRRHHAAVPKPKNETATSTFFFSRGPKVRWKAGEPGFAVLFAVVSHNMSREFSREPFGSVNKILWPEAPAM